LAAITKQLYQIKAVDTNFSNHQYLVVGFFMVSRITETKEGKKCAGSVGWRLVSGKMIGMRAWVNFSRKDENEKMSGDFRRV
jgi:hypothetical protein